MTFEAIWHWKEDRMKDVNLTGVERFFDDNEIIVSKTDTKGRMTYVTNVFLRLAGYPDKQCPGQTDSLIRNPDRPG